MGSEMCIRDRLCPSNGRCTTSARCCLKPRHAIRRFRSCYAVVLARRKLRHYFEAHPVTVVSSFPLGEIVRNREAEGRIAKWSGELMGETLTYAPHKAIKSQVLANFVAEWTDTQLPHHKSRLNAGPCTLTGQR